MPYKRRIKHRPLFASPVPRAVSKPKIKWRILPIVWGAIKRTCMLIGAMVLISLIISVWMTNQLVQNADQPLPDDMVLYIDFSDGIAEVPGEPNFANPFDAGAPTIRDLIDTIETAGDDDRIHAIVARLDGESLGIAHVQEIRAAIKKFRYDTGKFAFAYSSSLGDMGGGLGRYYLAAAFDEIWMQPLGIVSIPGINAEMPFLRETLDKIGVTPQFYQRKEYKSAYESLTRSHISDENLDMTEAMLVDIGTRIITDLSEDLNRPPEAIKRMINKGLFTAQEAREERLITEVDYADILVDEVTELLTGDPDSEEITFVPLSDYRRSLQPHLKEQLEKRFAKQDPETRKPKVALIYAVGMITPGKSGANTASAAPAFIDGGIASAQDIAQALLEAADDPQVEAIVMRVDSPGGSPTASETILRAAEKAQEEGKPVVVSMGPTAASGGYWISAYADRIFVQPATLTGSIGVVGGKFYLRDLWDKIGVNWDGVKIGENAGMWSINKPFNASEAERVNAMLDQVYDSFVDRVAKGRELSPDYVEKIAKGRVWTGQQAIQVGLADEIGGLNNALDYAATLLAREDRKAVEVEILPKPQTPLEKFINLMEGQAAMGQSVQWQRNFAVLLQPLLQQISIMQRPDLYSVYEPLSLK